MADLMMANIYHPSQGTKPFACVCAFICDVIEKVKITQVSQSLNKRRQHNHTTASKSARDIDEIC